MKLGEAITLLNAGRPVTREGWNGKGMFLIRAGGYKVNDFGCAANGGAIATDTSGTVPVANVAWIGGVNGTSVRNGWVSNIWYYPQKLTSAEISAFSKQG
jgi:hypothetical protein